MFTICLTYGGFDVEDLRYYLEASREDYLAHMKKIGDTGRQLAYEEHWRVLEEYVRLS